MDGLQKLYAISSSQGVKPAVIGQVAMSPPITHVASSDDEDVESSADEYTATVFGDEWLTLMVVTLNVEDLPQPFIVPMKRNQD